MLRSLVALSVAGAIYSTSIFTFSPPLPALAHSGTSKAQLVKLLISTGALTQCLGGLPDRSRARSCELIALSVSLGPDFVCDDPGLGPGLPFGAGVDDPEGACDDPAGMGLDGADDRSLSFCSFSDDTLSVSLTDGVFMAVWCFS